MGLPIEPLAEWALTRLLDELYPVVKDSYLNPGLDKLRKWIKTMIRRKKEKFSSVGFIEKIKIIDRHDQIQSIKGILQKDTPMIVMITGNVGLGKTRLLEETKYLVSQMNRNTNLQWCGILDFSDTGLQSIPNLMYSIMQKVDISGKYFADFRNKYEIFRESREKGCSGGELQAKINELSLSFQHDYNDYAREHRIVLAFDTLEKTCFEKEKIRDIFQFNAIALDSMVWLVNWLCKLENSVILLAGRSEILEIKELSQIPANRYSHIPLPPLSDVFLREYLKVSANSFPEQFLRDVNSVISLSKGSPVMLSLMVELLQKGWEVNPSDSMDRNLESWKKEVIKEFFQEDASLGILPLVLARKGLSPKLFQNLRPNLSYEDCQGKIDKLKKLSIVKTYPEVDNIFLHDAVYELFDELVPDKSPYKQYYLKLQQYYQHLQAVETGSRHRDAVSGGVYYSLHINALDAFEMIYKQWAEVAIMGHEFELDMQLRSELLRFWKSECKRGLPDGLTVDMIELDSMIRWVKRYVSRSLYQDAITVAEKFLACGPDSYHGLIMTSSPDEAHIKNEDFIEAKKILGSADLLFWGNLLSSYGEALAFTSTSSENNARKVLSLAIEKINSHLTETHASSWHYRLLARAHDRLGYLARIHGHYEEAIQQYEQSLRCNIESETKKERGLPYINQQSFDKSNKATTQNNLAFAHALIGDLELAQIEAKEALDDRIDIGHLYPIGLSHNTLGIILEYYELYDQACDECSMALNIFTENTDQRGIGLANNALGSIWRRRAERRGNVSHPREFVIDCFTQAEACLLKAIEIFKNGVNEPDRLCEALNELGSLYDDWGSYEYQQGNSKTSEDKFLSSARLLTNAVEIALDKSLELQLADIYSDLAQVVFKIGNKDKALAILENSLNVLRLSFENNINMQIPLHDAKWLVLGKAFLLRGSWSFLNHKYTSIDSDLISALDCFRKFYKRTDPSKQMIKRYFSDYYHIAQELDPSGQFIPGFLKEYNNNCV